MKESQYNLMLAFIKTMSAQAAAFFGTAAESSGYGSFACGGYDSPGNQEKNMAETPEHILKSVFGYDSFRPLQRDVIQNVLDGRDTVAVMPTGGGKSICYQIPALIMGGLTVVVSPLIALMQDQVSQLESLGIQAVFLNSAQESDDYFDTCRKIRSGKIKLLYVSPERLSSQRMQDLLHSENVNVDCITIDEAHCISEWGHDFRPDYMEIASVREQFPRAVCLALTATATKVVQNDIARHLKMESPSILVSSFNRPNLFLEVKRKSNAVLQISEYLSERKDQSGIIYCMSRKHVDALFEKLCAMGFSVAKYHAGLSDAARNQSQNDFIKGRVNIMIATVAFGMGINKPDVRFVIHYDLPKSIEQYYQEIGRAGRDGLPSSTLLLYSPADINMVRYFFRQKDDPSKDESLLHDMVQYAETRTCRRSFLLKYFGEAYNPLENDGQCCCDICTRGNENYDMTMEAQKYMSCILRTKQRHTASYVIDVLLGAKTKKILENGDNNLSTWGIGKDLSKGDWLELNACLLDAGYLNKSGDYNVLSLSPYGQKMLMERQKIMLPVQIPSEKSRQTFAKPKKKTTPLLDENDDEGKRIAENLRSWRKKHAEEMNVPPYVIFGDKTMLDIASKKPKTIKELLSCYGIGETKAKTMGHEILRIVDGV